MTMAAATLPLSTAQDWQPEQARQQVTAAIEAAYTAMQQAQQAGEAQALDGILALEAAENRLQQAWGSLSNQNAVMNSPEWRDTYNSLLPELSRFYTEQGQNQALYQVYQRVAAFEAFATLSPARQEAIRLALRDFQLSGVALEGAAKARYAEISERLSALSSQFSDQLLDATQSWVKPLSSTELAGLPDSAVALLKQMGEAKGFDQPVATLDGPVYLAIMTYAEDRALRESVYRAYVTRASDQAIPSPAKAASDAQSAQTLPNNGPLMVEILQLRQEMANLLGFANYAELSLASKMAPNVAAVRQFLVDLAQRAQVPAQRDLALLEAEGKAVGIDQIQPWDTAFLAERIKQRDYNLSQESLRPYLPAPKVIEGLFAIAKKLFGVDIVPKQAAVWHPDVTYYEVEEAGEVLGGFYFDLYARQGKRGGAWMSGYRSRTQLTEGLQKPVAFMVGNFAPPVEGKPALLTHDELVTLFHEFGHGLHHLLTEVDVLPVAGVNGVAWDAVELPSQFMEFWTWEPEALALLSAHLEDQSVLPQEMIQALLAARHFQSGMQALRQVEFALFDLDIHAQNPAPDEAGIQATLDTLRAQYAVMQPPAYNRFQNSFSHIFAGGYAAGYYSYKWAEVLASDAFSRFETEGVFNAETGRAFRSAVLAKGGSKPAADTFRDFRGRDASIDALVRHSGWVGETQTATGARA